MSYAGKGTAIADMGELLEGIFSFFQALIRLRKAVKYISNRKNSKQY